MPGWVNGHLGPPLDAGNSSKPMRRIRFNPAMGAIKPSLCPLHCDMDAVSATG